MFLGSPLTVHWLVRGDLHVVLDQGGFAMLPDLSLMNKIEAIFKDTLDNWHTFFDKREWVLLPPLDILHRILQATSETLVSSGARPAADEGCPLVTEASSRFSRYEHFSR